MKNKSNQLRNFYILWSTQSLSHLGSSITSFALTLWLYEKTGSALGTAALTICTYAPYVIMSIFAGAITDRFDKKKTMLVCDALAALTTVLVFVLYRTNELSGWHLYGINAFSGLMNTVQQPASEVTNEMADYAFWQRQGFRSSADDVHPWCIGRRCVPCFRAKAKTVFLFGEVMTRT